jgi:excinuclease ABC subunit B
MKSQPFKLVSKYSPAGDQPRVISEMTKSIQSGRREQTILGATGTGKTFMMASIVNNLQKPTLVIAHNKTLAAQLAEEFKQFFPNNAVHYFVSYYDYYQPESYLPRSDTFIEKQTQINEEIERLRNATTQSLLTRKDVLIVASVSCIYGLGNPEDFEALKIELEVGGIYKMDKIARRLIDLQFVRTNLDLKRGYFRLRGDVMEIYPSNEDNIGYRLSFFGDELEEIERFSILTGQGVGDGIVDGEYVVEQDDFNPFAKPKELDDYDTSEHPTIPGNTKLESYTIFPAKQYVTTKEKIQAAIKQIETDLYARVDEFHEEGKLLQAQRIKDRTLNDLEMLDQMGFCGGIENYSSYFDGRGNGEAPNTLLDYFPDNSLCFIDESHITLPQIGAMYHGDRSRKTTLVEYGFRLPAAMNNRPLQKKEFFNRVGQMIYVSATPGQWELGYGDFEDETNDDQETVTSPNSDQN